MVQNTSMTVSDIGNLRFNEFEELLEGLSKNNADSSGSKSKTLTGSDAIKYLMAQK